MRNLFIFAAVALATLPALAQSTNSAPTPTSNAPATDDRREKFKEAMEQLNLSDVQKQKIKQIRESTPAGPERRQQIMAVLNADQQAKLQQMMATWRQHTHVGTPAQ